MRPFLLFPALLALSGALRCQAIFDVAPAGAYTQIQQAIAVAPPGSTIRVATGSYAPFTLARGLTILAQPAAQVLVIGQSTIANVPAGETAAVAGLRLRSRDWLANQTDNHALVVGPCAGGVLLRGCTLETGTVTWRGSGIPAPISALLVSDCRLLLDDVTCTGASGTHGAQMSFTSATSGYVTIIGGMFRGGDSDCGPFCFPDSAPAGHGALIAQAPVVYASEATFRGGDVVNLTQTTSAGIGLALPGSVALLRQCLAQGGTSGVHPGNVGGIGLLTTSTTSVDRDGGAFVGGAAGGGSGVPGVPVAGPVVPLPHLLASLVLTPTFFDRGQLAGVSLRSHPFEPHITFFGVQLAGALLPLPGINEPLVLDPLAVFIAFASLVTGPSGAASLAVPIPNDPSLIGRPVFFQDAGLDQSLLRTFLSSPAGTVVR